MMDITECDPSCFDCCRRAADELPVPLAAKNTDVAASIESTTMARIDAMKYYTTADRPLIVIPPDPAPTTTVSPPDPPIRPIKKAKRRLTAVSQEKTAVDPPTRPMKKAKRRLTTVSHGQPAVSQTPTVSTLATVPSVTTMESKKPASHRRQATVPSSTVPSTVGDLMLELGRLNDAGTSLLIRIQESEEAGDSLTTLDLLSQIETLTDTKNRLIETCKQQVRETRPVMKENRQILVALEEIKKAIDLMSNQIRLYRAQRGVAQEATVPPVPAVLPAHILSRRRTAVRATVPLKKLVEIRKGVGSMETFYVEGLVTMSKEGEKREKKSRSAARKEKKWKEIFVPFDEEEGKLVEKLIERMMEVKPFVEKE